MSLNVWISARTIDCPKAGGHLWVYLNWALGLQALGCKVVWLEQLSPVASVERLKERLGSLRKRLAPYGLADSIALYGPDWPLEAGVNASCISLEEGVGADLLLDMSYGLSTDFLSRFRRSVLIDIDPGLLQLWMSQGQLTVGMHSSYFSIGESVSGGLDAGQAWHHTPPCVSLEHWPVCPAEAGAPFTTVSNWFEDEWVEYQGKWFRNDKKTGFEAFLDLPQQTGHPLELALCLGDGDSQERAMLEERNWRIRHAWDVTSTPWDYQSYIQASKGEFSCCKPSCLEFSNGWISDRTVCYLASGKPAIVQRTGPSKFLPDAAGLFRFSNMEQAVDCIEEATSAYEDHSRLARALAEEYFDARKVVAQLLERATA